MAAKNESGSTGSGNNGSGMNGIGVIVGLLAIVAAVYSMVEPMNLRITQLSDLLGAARSDMRADDEREREDARSFSAMDERFKEVETQFRALRDLSELKDSELARRLELVEMFGNPRHDERLKVLERLIKK